jgi:hypothetical protein
MKKQRQPPADIDEVPKTAHHVRGHQDLCKDNTRLRLGLCFVY